MNIQASRPDLAYGWASARDTRCGGADTPPPDRAGLGPWIATPLSSEENPGGLRSARPDACATPGDCAAEEANLPATATRLLETPAYVQEIDIYIREIDTDGPEIAFYIVEIGINCLEMTT